MWPLTFLSLTGQLEDLERPSPVSTLWQAQTQGPGLGLSLPQRLRLTVGWEEGGRGELVTVAGFTAGQHCGQLAVWTLHAEVETLKGRSGPRRRTETLTLVWAVPRLVRHCCLGLTCSLGPWLSCKWGYVRNCSQSLSGSLNDMYNLSAKTGSVNKEVKPFPVTFVKCGAFRIRNCC